jgi:hypothetical protein
MCDGRARSPNFSLNRRFSDADVMVLWKVSEEVKDCGMGGVQFKSEKADSGTLTVDEDDKLPTGADVV